jgi:hypothetical protein
LGRWAIIAHEFDLSREKIQSESKKWARRKPDPFFGLALLAALRVRVVLAGLLLTWLLLILLAALALLLAGLLAGLRLVLVALLLIVLARLILVRHVIDSMGVGLPQPSLNPCPLPTFRKKAIVPKVSWLQTYTRAKRACPLLQLQKRTQIDPARSSA